MMKDIVKIKIVIVDDHQLVIEGLKSLLKPRQEIKIVASFTKGHELLQFLKNTVVDVILLDINLPDINGVDLCKLITKEYKDIAVVGLSTYSDRSIINEMISNGAKGYLLKNVTESELNEAVRKVYLGSYYYGSEIQKIMANTIFQTLGEIPRLTKREKQILKEIISGKTTNIIAKELFISSLTVETHRRNLMKKMNAPNVASLVKIAIDKMLV